MSFYRKDSTYIFLFKLKLKLQKNSLKKLTKVHYFNLLTTQTSIIKIPKYTGCRTVKFLLEIFLQFSKVECQKLYKPVLL